MAGKKQSLWIGYAGALGIAVLALSFSYMVLETKRPFLPCVAAVMLISWLYGRGPGILAGAFFVLFTSSMIFIKIPPLNNAELWRDVARELIFICVSIIAITITTAKDKAEAQARERSEWLSFTLANIANGVITADSQGRIVFMNPMARRMTGYGDDAIGMPCGDVFKIVALETKEELENPIAKALRECAPARIAESVILISKDGRRYAIEDSAASVNAPEGSLKDVVLVFRDVTEQRRIETELRGAAERLQLALDAGKLIPWEWNIASGELISDGLQKLLPGTSIKTRNAFMELIHPDDLEPIKNIAATAMETGNTYFGEYRLIKPGGEILWIESRAQPIFNEHGEAVRMLGVLRDMTEQKLVENIVRDGQEQFRNVAEGASDGFVTTDEKGKILYANGAFGAIFGYQRSDLIGMQLAQLVPERLRERHLLGIEHYIQTGQKSLDWRNAEFPGLCKDGSEVPLEMSFSETRAGAKRLLSAIVRDVSQRKRDQEAVQAAHERLKLAQRIAGLGTFEWDFRAGRTTLSAELATMYGFKPGEFGGTHEAWLKIVHPDDVERMQINARLIQHEDLPEYSSTYRVIWPDKSIHWLTSKLKVFRSATGEPLWALGVNLDITREKEAQVEHEILLLNEKTARERLALANRIAGIGTYEIDMLTGQVDMSPESGLLYGLEPGKLFKTQAEWAEHVLPEDLKREMDHLRSVFEAHAPDFQGEFRILRPDKSVRWLATKGKIFYDESGAPTKLLGAEQDITAQKEANSERETLLSSERTARERLELAQRIAGLGTFEWDMRTGKGSISVELAAMYGLNPGDLEGTYETWEKIVHPDDVEMVREKTRILMQEDLPEYSSTYRVIWPDKSVHWMSSKTKMFRDEAGAPLCAMGVNLDITREKEAEAERETLLANEMAARVRMELAQRIAGMGTFEWDMRTGRASISAELEAMYGFKPGEFDGNSKTWEKIVHPDDLETMQEKMRVLMQENLPEYSASYRIIWPDKSVHWMASKTIMFRDEAGAPLNAMGVNLDITREKEAEAERETLLTNEMAARVRMELAHWIAGFGTFEWDAATGQTTFSPELEALYGLKRGEFRQTYEHWRELIHPGDWPFVEENGRQARLSGSDEYAAEFRVIWPDKSVHWITTKGKFYRNEKGEVLRLVGVEQDVTERKTSEAERERLLASEKWTRERLELAQRAAGIGIYERWFRAGIVQCSPELLKLMGLPPEKTTFSHDDWIAMIHPEDRRSVLRGVSDASRASGDYYLEYRVIWPDRTIHWLASNGRVLSDEKGEPELSVGATLDITEHKAIAAERERIIDREKAARADAERASQLKDEFLATVSHELRTPLTAVIGWARLLLESPSDEAMFRRGLDSIERNGRAQARLVEDLLDISRIVTGRMLVQLQPLDLSEVVEAAVDGIRPTAQAKKIQLDLKLAPLVRVNGDVDRLQQVAFNILFNAVKFSHIKGRVQVRVESDGHVARLIVHDDGKGINPAFLPNLFQRFSQEDSSSTRRFGGMGLGLAIARHLVELHGGSVRAQSEGEGKGATLTVELPMLRSSDSGLIPGIPPMAAFPA